jgi:RNA polymerase subunit RPABC4/transcription elongation factor Spt4
MDEIFKTIGDTIGGFFANPIIELAIQLFVVYVIVLWLAAAYWAFRDMQLRSDNPVLPYVAAALIVLFTPVLFLLGVIVYRIVRPQEKIGEVYERNLAEEALLAEVETVRSCPSCRRRVHDEWIICPTCRTRLNRVCANCGRLVGLDWSLCAWCGRDFERTDMAAYEPIATTMPERLEPTATAPAAASAPATATSRASAEGRAAGPRQSPRPSSGRRSSSGQTSEP